MASLRRIIRCFPSPSTTSRAWAWAAARSFSPDDYASAYQPGHFWTTLLEGDHVSSDVALVDGEPQWWRHATGVASGAGTFDYWEVHAVPSPAVEDWCGAWCRRHLKGYTGCSTSRPSAAASSRCICASPTSGPISTARGWVEAIVRLYASREWRFDDSARRTGYSVVLFVPHGWRLPPSAGRPAARDRGDAGRLERADHLS